MAGTYPNSPSNRLAWHVDGSILWQRNSGTGTVVEQSLSKRQALNGESLSAETLYNSGAGSSWGIYFPRKIDLRGIYSFVNNHGLGYLIPLSYSTDTTDGYNGTWTTISSDWPDTSGGPTNPSAYRYPTAMSYNGVKGIRWVMEQNQFTVYSIHVYGTYSSGEDTNKLEIWDSAIDARVSASYFDFGDMQKTTQATKTFRVKNTSSTLSASNIVVSTSALTDPSPTFVANLSLSTDNSIYTTAASIPSLAPGATSGTLYIKSNLSNGIAIGVRSAMLTASAGTWA